MNDLRIPDSSGFRKGMTLKRIILAVHLLVMMVLFPMKAEAQTRLFQPGDSGVIVTLDFLLVSENYHGNNFSVLRGSYTHNGLWDLGLEYGKTDLHSDLQRVFAYFGNYALINPQPGDRWGLEAGLRYSNYDSEYQIPPVYGYFIPDYNGVRHRSIIPGLRVFYRNNKADDVIGLGVSYRFRKFEVLSPEDEVLIGYDYEELGFDLDVHSRVWGAMHLSMELDYSQHKSTPGRYNSTSGEYWEFTAIFSIGVMLGRASEDGGASDE